MTVTSTLPAMPMRAPRRLALPALRADDVAGMLRHTLAALLGLGTLHPGGTLVLDDPALEMPVLGRYRVDKVLGQGAMGMVYLGHDPKIGRPLAIKTLALGQAFEGAALACSAPSVGPPGLGEGRLCVEV